MRLLTLAFISLFMHFTYADTALPPFFEAEYTIHGKGMQLGVMERSFQRTEDGGYRFASKSHTTGVAAVFRRDKIFETSLWLQKNNGPLSLSYEYQRIDSRKNRHTHVVFDWQSGQIQNIAKRRPWKIKAQNGVIDQHLVQLLLMSELRKSKPQLDYLVANKGELQQYTFTSIGNTLLETPLGKLETEAFVYATPNSKRKITLWFATKLKYLPVKIENLDKKGKRTTAKIQQVNWNPGPSISSLDAQSNHPTDP